MTPHQRLPHAASVYSSLIFFQQPTLANSLPNYPGSVDKSGDRRESHLPVPTSGTIFSPTFYGRH